MNQGLWSSNQPDLPNTRQIRLTHRLKSRKTKLKGKSTTIQTAGWQEGVYIVRVKYKDEVLTGKLVVKE